MEEDIEILKEIKEEYDYAFGTKIYRPHSISREEIQAISNIINRLEQDKRVIEEMGKYIEDKAIDDVCTKKDCYADIYENGHCKKCVNCIIDHFRKKCE